MYTHELVANTRDGVALEKEAQLSTVVTPALGGTMKWPGSAEAKPTLSWLAVLEHFQERRM